MRALLQDLKYALRQMRHAPGFSVSVVLVLALGIGANAAMFTVLEGTLFRPLPYQDAGKLVTLKPTDSKGEHGLSGLADESVWALRTHTLSQIAYFDPEQAYLNGQAADGVLSEQKVGSVKASANLFATLGVAPALGRSFTEAEQQPGRENVVVLSDDVWKAQFHADKHVLGKAVRLDDAMMTVIGVMPPGFRFPAQQDQVEAQVWRPAAIAPRDLTRTFDAAYYEMIGRRVAGASIADVAKEISAFQKQLVPLYTGDIPPGLAPTQVEVMDYRRSLNPEDQRKAILALFGAVGLLWLIVCANVACLMLARTATRRREMAVRSALGASGWRLARQTMVESLLLSLSGGAVGLALAHLALRVFRHSLATQLSSGLSLYPDARVTVALFGLSVVSALIFGVGPARAASSAAVEQSLRQDGAQAGTGRHQHRLQRLLVVAELAMTLVMLVCCGLLLRTVFALKQVPLGFRTDHVFVIEPHLPDYKYEKADTNGLVYKPLLERLKMLPGIESAAVTTVAPLHRGFNVSLQLYVSRDDKGKKAQSSLVAALRASGPELRQVLGFGVVSGRYFNAQDTSESEPVAVVNRAFAKLYEPSGGDISRFHLGGDGRQWKIIGVIEDFHQGGIADAPMPEIDLDAAQMRPTDGFYQPTLHHHAELMLRSKRDAKSLLPEIDRVMREMNPDLAGSEIRTMDQIVEDAMGSQILAAHLLEALGGLALLVALAGLYSLLAYLVTLRTRELGLRMALGAQREDVLALVLRGAGVLLVMGTVIGVGISLVAARLMHSFLFEVKEYDPVSFLGAPVLLLAVGAFAAWLPARRASRLEPMEALRTE
jgi:predicted permease